MIYLYQRPYICLDTAPWDVQSNASLSIPYSTSDNDTPKPWFMALSHYHRDDQVLLRPHEKV